MTDETKDMNEPIEKESTAEPVIEPIPEAPSPAPEKEEPAHSTGFSSYSDAEYAGAGVGEKTTLTPDAANARPTPPPHPPVNGSSFDANRTAYTAPNPQHTYNGATEPQKPKTRKKERGGMGAGKIALLLVVCVLLSTGAGFGGAMLYGVFNSLTENVGQGSPSAGNQINVNKVESNGNATPEEGSLAAVIAQVSDTVVEIRTEQVVNGSFFGNYVSEGAGSGVIISADGYIITNNHVIEGADTITVSTKSGEEYAAELIATDSRTDIAVIKVDATDLHAAAIGSSADLVVGERAIAIGNPLGELGGSVTLGYISALDRELTIDGSKMTLLQTDAAINPGNSGGALFNAAGELIGIVNAKSSGDAIEGLGFAIPIDTAYAVATDLIENGHVSGRPALGVKIVEIADGNDYYQYRGTELGEFIDSYGVYVVSDSQGNFQLGDRLVAIDGTSVSTLDEITELLSDKEIGDMVSATYSRNRKMAEVEVTLIELTE